MENIELFYSFTETSEFTNIFMPLVIKCFDCPVDKIQILVLGKTSFLMNTFSYPTFIK